MSSHPVMVTIAKGRKMSVAALAFRARFSDEKRAPSFPGEDRKLLVRSQEMLGLEPPKTKNAIKVSHSVSRAECEAWKDIILQGLSSFVCPCCAKTTPGLATCAAVQYFPVQRTALWREWKQYRQYQECPTWASFHRRHASLRLVCIVCSNGRFVLDK